MKAVRQEYANSTDTVAFLGLTLQPRSLPQMSELVEQGIRERQEMDHLLPQPAQCLPAS